MKQTKIMISKISKYFRLIPRYINRIHLRYQTRHIQVGLAILWLLDGLLQLQPKMFSHNFAPTVILPLAQGQPHWIMDIVKFNAMLFGSHPAILNGIIIFIQLGLAAAMLYRPLSRYAFALSVPYSLMVWVAGEGAGGILTGSGSLIFGAPGPVLLYALIAASLLTFKSNPTERPSGTHRWMIRLSWFLLWVGGAVLSLLPPNNSSHKLAAQIISNTDHHPYWLYHLISITAKAISSGGHLSFFIIIMLQLIIGFSVMSSSKLVLRIGYALGCLMALFFFVIGQDMANIFSGFATDPGNGPLIILMAYALYRPNKSDHVYHYRLLSRISQLLGYKQIKSQN